MNTGIFKLMLDTAQLYFGNISINNNAFTSVSFNRAVQQLTTSQTMPHRHLISLETHFESILHCRIAVYIYKKN